MLKLNCLKNIVLNGEWLMLVPTCSIASRDKFPHHSQEKSSFRTADKPIGYTTNIYIQAKILIYRKHYPGFPRFKLFPDSA